MPTELKVPELGESVTEVEIGRWLVKEGDAVKIDQPVVELETDKVNQELPATVDGAITKFLLKEGDTARVGDVIAHIEEGAAGTKPSSNGKAAPAKAPASPEAPAPSAAQTQAPSNTSEARIMPAAQRLLDENSLSAGDIAATGPGGRLLKEDVLKHLENKQAAPTQPAPAQPAPVTPRQAAAAPSTDADRPEEVVRMNPLRRTIAKALVNAQQTAALLTTFNEVDMTAVMAMRKKYQDSFVKKYGIKLGFMSFFVKASIEALKQFPSVNAEVRGDEIVYKYYYDIGIAIGGGKGLVVPVVRNAERLSFAGTEQAISDYAVKAKNNKLQLSELTNGSFTITNGGIYGSLLSTPIVNAPQSGVLGMHGIIRRPIAVGKPGVDERIEIRPMMYLALTYDHRLVDGREAVTFVKTIKDIIEDPARMLIEA